MCAAAHGWAGLGKIIYAASGEQLNKWMEEWHQKPSPIYYYPIKDVIKNIKVVGPVIEFEDKIKELHYQSLKQKKLL